MVYFIVLAVIFYCIYTYDYKRHKVGSSVMYIGVCVILIIIAGLRYRIGGDSIGYENEFKNSIPTLANLRSFRFNSIRWEPGFVLLMSTAKSFSTDFTLFQFFHATIVNSIIFWFISRNTQNRFIAVCLYFVCMYLNFNTEVLRESLAVSIFLLAWPFFKQGKWLLYYPLAICACFFHTSALFTLILPLFAIPGVRGGFRLSKLTFFICIFVFVGSFYLGRKFFSVIKMLSQTETISDRANEYAKSSYGGTVLNVLGMTEVLIKNVFIPIAAVWYLRLSLKNEKGTKKYKEFQKQELMVMTSVYISIASMSIFILGRFNNYLLLFTYITLASCFFKKVEIRRKKFKLSAIYWVAIFMVVLSINFKSYFASTFGSSSHKRYMLYYPYYSRLEPTEDTKREEILRFAVHIR